jgi:hypothetical protein
MTRREHEPELPSTSRHRQAVFSAIRRACLVLVVLKRVGVYYTFPPHDILLMRCYQALSHCPTRSPSSVLAGGGVWRDNHTLSSVMAVSCPRSLSRSVLSAVDLCREHPDLFILKNLVKVGKDTNGGPVLKAETNESRFASGRPQRPGKAARSLAAGQILRSFFRRDDS